ncbi:secretogranin-3 [Pristis pectinata]|uniref:secretogranin-3 n=1 Tax=Pristis pectinata TaxID=685728 RepID=UPI00223E217D|nr:secretogranin-3 [Pristis pectinata]
MPSKYTAWVLFLQTIALVLYQINAFPTPEGPQDKAVSNRELSAERPVDEQIAEAGRVGQSTSTEDKVPLQNDSFADDFMLLKSLAEKENEKEGYIDQNSPSDSFPPPVNVDSTKSRRLAEDYDDSTKSAMDYKDEDDPDGLHQLEGTPLTAEDIVQKIANRIYEENDRGVFDRIVSKLLNLGLITENQANNLEDEVAAALQKIITDEARKNEVRVQNGDYPVMKTDEDLTEGEGEEEVKMTKPTKKQSKFVKEESYSAPGNTWHFNNNKNQRSSALTADGMEDLQYFPNFYNLLQSLNTEQDAKEKETLITIMKTLIDFVKMMVKYGTIKPEEGVSYLENLDAMIAVQTKSKLGKVKPYAINKEAADTTDDLDSTKNYLVKQDKETTNSEDSTKEEVEKTENSKGFDKTETYLSAIRKNIEWLKKHKQENGEGYDLQKLRDIIDHQVDTYVQKGILEEGEGDVIKRIYNSL